jgi:hypothetical protein
VVGCYGINKKLIARRQWLTGTSGSAHACNPSYSGGKDQEDCGLKPAQANSSARPYLEKPFTKNRAGGVAQGEGPEFKP